MSSAPSSSSGWATIIITLAVVDRRLSVCSSAAWPRSSGNGRAMSAGSAEGSGASAATLDAGCCAHKLNAPAPVRMMPARDATNAVRWIPREQYILLVSVQSVQHCCLMIPSSSISGNATKDTSGSLERRIGLRSAVLFNMLEMIGVGPFITLPLVIAAAGYRLSVWAWLLGAAIAVADGLVWAELGAAFPRAGGSYAFPRRCRLLQVASGCRAFWRGSGRGWTGRRLPRCRHCTTQTLPRPRRACW